MFKKSVFLVIALLAVFTAVNVGAQSRNRVEWPDTEYTRQVPRPPFDIRSIGDMSELLGFIHVNFVEATVEGIEAYISSLKERGFTINEVFNKTEGGGETNIIFEGENSQGWAVSVRYIHRTAVTLGITKLK